MSEWISVKDRLPSEVEDVLLLGKSSDGRFNSIIVGRYSPEMHRKVYGDNPWSIKLFGHQDLYLCMEMGRLYNPQSSDNFYFGEITHWCEFPKPPEQPTTD